MFYARSIHNFNYKPYFIASLAKADGHLEADRRTDRRTGMLIEAIWSFLGLIRTQFCLIWTWGGLNWTGGLIWTRPYPNRDLFGPKRGLIWPV